MTPDRIKLEGYDAAHYRRALGTIPPDAARIDEAKALLRELRRLSAEYGRNLGALWAIVLHETGKLRSDLWADELNPAGIKDNAGKDRRYRNGVDAARALFARVMFYAEDIGGITGELAKYDYLWGGRARIRGYTAKHGRPASVAGLSVDGEGWAEDPAWSQKVARIYGLAFGRSTLTPAGYPLAVLLVSGHRNHSGGHPVETAKTPELASAYLAELRARRIWTEHVQAIDGDGDPDDTQAGLATVATLARDWMARQRLTDRVPVMLDLHYESGGAGGVFAIIPDAPGDSYADNGLDRAIGARIVSGIHEETGLPIRSAGVMAPGLMSERQTGVGAQGHRLGMFALTAPVRDYGVRLVIEHGALDKQPDRGIVDAPGFAARAASGAADGLVLAASDPATRAIIEAVARR